MLLVIKVYAGENHAAADLSGPLGGWRDEAERVQKLIENDFNQAYGAANRLAETLPVDAPGSDRVKSLNLLSRVEIYLGLIDRADRHAREALALAEQYADQAGKVEAYLNTGLNAIYQADMEALTSSPIKAMPLLEHINEPRLLAETMLQATMMYIRLERLEDSFAIAIDAMEIAGRQNDPLVLAYAHQGLGEAYVQNFRTTRALEHFQLMLESARAAQSKRLEASALTSLGAIHGTLGDYVLAEQYVRESISLFDKMGGPFYLTHSLFTLADIFQRQQRFDEAMVYFSQFVQVLEENPNPIGLWWGYFARGQLERKMGGAATAGKDLQKAYDLAATIGLSRYLSASLRALAEVAAEQGNHALAYQRFKEADEIAETASKAKTSEQTVEVVQRITQQNNLRQLEQMERRNQEQELELERQQLKRRSAHHLLAACLLGLTASIVLFLRVLRSHRLLQRTNSQLMLNSQVFEQSAEGILICDAQRNIASVNRAYCEMTGYTENELKGKATSILRAGFHDESFYQKLWESVESEGSWQGEIWFRRKNGDRYPALLSVSAVKDNEGAVSNYISISSDISKYKRAEEHIHQLAYYDGLTGLPNKTLIHNRIDQAIANARRSGRSFALMFLDLDRFQNINDSLGHRVGDAVLVEVARRLNKVISSEDTLSRLGGDDFIFLLAGDTCEAVDDMADTISQALVAPFQIDSHELIVTASIGISVYPRDGKTRDALVQSADSAMNQAKKDGRNTFRFFTEDMYLHTSRILKLENALRGALERKEFTLHYQPQADVRMGRIVGCEALLRWWHPEFGVVSPAEFIPIAEENGLILSIGEWVLQTAVQQVKSWEREGLPLLPVAVNLSAVQFRQPALLDTIIRVLRKNSLAPEYLELELTESIMMDDPTEAISIMTRLHDLGVRLAIDDFGTGYSSLSYLKRLKIHKLKIDQSFVKDISVDADDAEIVRTIIALARSFKLHTIAEGVETKAQQAILQSEGCDEVQGYLFSKPLPADEFARFFRRCLQLQQVQYSEKNNKESAV